jgi:hypothetical protein
LVPGSNPGGPTTPSKTLCAPGLPLANSDATAGRDVLYPGRGLGLMTLLQSDIFFAVTLMRNPRRIAFMRNLILLTPLLLLLDANATVTNVAWYRLGENDAGAASGGIVDAATIDLVGANHLKQYNNPRYTNVFSTASLAVDSSLGIHFDGGSQYLSNSIVTVAVDNFGMETWVRMGAGPGNGYIVCNGNPFTGGWSIVCSGNQYQAAYGTSVSFGGGFASPGVWTHLALVRQNGITTFYVNGVASGSTGWAPNPPSGGFVVAAQASAFPAEFFNGDIDEIRVFEFVPGQFSTNDLLLNVTNVRTLPAAFVTISNATLNGSVYKPGNQVPQPSHGWFEWGLAPGYGNATPIQIFGSGAVATNFSQTITGLMAGTMYQFRTVADLGGNLIFGTNRTFTTPGPQVATLPASGTNTTTVTLNAMVNSGGITTSAWFQWGTSTNYGNATLAQSVGAGASFTNYNQVIIGGGGETYYFRPVASNALGVVYGTAQSFSIPTFRLVETDVPPLSSGSVAWGDYDNDGWLDILITGRDSIAAPIAQVWRNTGNGFTNINAGFVGVTSGYWGDYDNDGRLDILVSGLTTNECHIQHCTRVAGRNRTGSVG